MPDKFLGRAIPVDKAARLDIDKLEAKLEKSLENKHPVFAVVGIIGSTEGKQIPFLSLLSKANVVPPCYVFSRKHHH